MANLPSPLVEPTLRDDLPRYPPLLQLLRVTAATVPGPAGVAQAAGSSVPGPTLYVSFTQQLRTDTMLPNDREPCLVDDVNGTGLAPGFYLGRLAGSWTSLPVYECVGAAPSSTSNTVTTFNAAVTFNAGATFNGTVTVNSLVNFGTSGGVGVKPPGTLSKPTLTVTGAPTWVPAAGTYPMVWGAYDHLDWEYDGLVRTPGGSSATPGGTGWVALVSVGRTAVNDANYTCTTIDRIIAYTAITAARVVTLPPANSLPPGFTMRVQDESGSAGATNTISVARAGTDKINGSASNLVVVNTARGGAEAETDGVSNWTVRQYATGSGTTGTSGQSVLGSNYAVTGSFANVGLSVILPNAGTYLVTAQVSGQLTDGSVIAIASIQARLYNTTDGAAIANSQVTVVNAPITGIALPGTATITARIVTAGANKVIDLQAIVLNGSAPTALIVCSGVSATNSDTVMDYVQLA